LRRRALLRHLRPDLEYVEFRGNVDTRLRKLNEGQAAAIILAAAGLDRLGKTEWIRERLQPEVMCPAPGQGALGIEIRANDLRMRDVVKFLDDSATRFAVTAERVALAELGGGCQVPVGVYCWPMAEVGFEIVAVVADPAGSRAVRSRTTGLEAESLGRAVAADLLRQGASELLAEIGMH
jgi:hydroxymethylbilane synthase